MARYEGTSRGRAWACTKLLLLALMSTAVEVRVSAQLSMNYYVTSCPNVETIVNAWLVANVFTDPTGPAALVRLIFHDCQVGGCDASILLDTQPGIQSELESGANFGIRDIRFIDSIKGAVELVCPNTVSCADILAMAARDCVSITRGPYINIPLGRRDGTQASNLEADARLPHSDISADNMLNEFAEMGMTAEESVAILGAHTIGVGHCVNVLNRMYPTIDPTMAMSMQMMLSMTCPTDDAANLNNNTILPNDSSNFFFDNQYFKDVLAGRGLFKIDSNIAYDPNTILYVNHFANDQNYFFQVFSSAFVKLVSYGVLTGTQGEIRKNCHLVN
ncbi:unnamed protein product [Calypogeia fissa]